MNGMNVVGVQFRRAGKIYDFNAKNLLVSVGDMVVVDTERGPSLAEVKRIGFIDSEGPEADAIKPVMRVATEKDLDTTGRLTSEEAERYSRDKIHELGLDMRVINAEVQFGGNKVLLYFSAPGRVDFRELVKELASGLRTRVELKQVGARDEAKQTGGIGICGREFCCSSFLREFVPVSIKMAKNQNLALNPSKVSGGCGRLLCCLTYEDDVYKELRQKLLPKRTRVSLPDGTLGDVVKGDILNQRMLVETDSGEQVSVPISELTVVDQKARAVDEEWGDDLDIGALMGDDEEVSMADEKPRPESGARREGRPEGGDRSPRAPEGQQRPRRDERSSQGQRAPRPQEEGGGERKGRSRGGRGRAKGGKKPDGGTQ